MTRPARQTSAQMQAACDQPAVGAHLIWSDYHNAWHRRSATGGASGYVSDIVGAGLFEPRTALAYDGDGRNRAIPVVEVQDKLAARLAELDAHRALVLEKLAVLDKPVRVQLRRSKGWRMPANTVKVDRTTRWGNPFTISQAIESGFADAAGAQAFVVECFRDWIGPSQSGRDWWAGPRSDKARRVFIEDIGALRGKHLACWCKLSAPCHADLLLKMANPDAIALTHTAAEVVR